MNEWMNVLPEHSPKAGSWHLLFLVHLDFHLHSWCSLLECPNWPDQECSALLSLCLLQHFISVALMMEKRKQSYLYWPGKTQQGSAYRVFWDFLWWKEGRQSWVDKPVFTSLLLARLKNRTTYVSVWNICYFKMKIPLWYASIFRRIAAVHLTFWKHHYIDFLFFKNFPLNRVAPGYLRSDFFPREAGLELPHVIWHLSWLESFLVLFWGLPNWPGGPSCCFLTSQGLHWDCGEPSEPSHGYFGAARVTLINAGSNFLLGMHPNFADISWSP